MVLSHLCPLQLELNALHAVLHDVLYRPVDVGQEGTTTRLRPRLSGGVRGPSSGGWGKRGRTTARTLAAPQLVTSRHLTQPATHGWCSTYSQCNSPRLRLRRRERRRQRRSPSVSSRQGYPPDFITSWWITLTHSLTRTLTLTLDDVTNSSDGCSDRVELDDNDEPQSDGHHSQSDNDEYDQDDDLYEEPSRVKRVKIESKSAKSTTKSKGKGRAGVDRLSTLPFELVAMVSQT